MRWLCVCEGGNSRSNGMGFVLKWEFNQEAIAVGWRYVSPETMEMLCNWATDIVIMRQQFAKYIPEQFASKVSVCEVGEDSYLMLHPHLLAQCRKFLDERNVTRNETSAAGIS